MCKCVFSSILFICSLNVIAAEICVYFGAHYIGHREYRTERQTQTCNTPNVLKRDDHIKSDNLWLMFEDCACKENLSYFPEVKD